ncbi:hypothetical protein IW262DRAFT_474338 [Armillaria fumosa]|nr:hypothetical protein IW262DRAFT_474338 [Armillaria fumosa]
MTSPLRNSNHGSGNSAKLIPLEEKEFNVTDVTASHPQGLQHNGDLTSSQSHPDVDYPVHVLNRTQAGTLTTTVISHRHHDHPILFTPFQQDIERLENEIDSLTTTMTTWQTAMTTWQVASQVETALYDYLYLIVLLPSQRVRIQNPGAVPFFKSIRRSENRRQHGLGIFPSDAADFHLWNTQLKPRWDDILTAIRAKKEYLGTFRHPNAHPPTGTGDYDDFITSLQLPPAQQALLSRARTDMLSLM